MLRQLLHPGSGWTPFALLAEMGAEQLVLLRAGPRTLLARWTNGDEYVARYDW